MRHLSFAVFCLLGTGGVSAEEVAPDFEQLFEQSQQALQAMLEAPAREVPAPVRTGAGLNPSTTRLAQEGLNAVNFVSSNADLNEITQTFSGQQWIDNRIALSSSNSDAIYSVDQSGANYANMLRGRTVNFANQKMSQGAEQVVYNNLVANGAFIDVVQSGVNVANIAMAKYAIGAADQEIQDKAIQEIDNRIEFKSSTNRDMLVDQSGVNFGNVIVAERVDDVTRVFAGNQFVTNTVILNGSTVPRISQSGSNIANYLSASSIGTVRQLSSGTQSVTNRVIGPDGERLSHPNIVQTELNYQGASNVVNLMILQSDRSANQQPVLVEQEADFDQSASGSSQQSQMGNVIVISR